MTCDLSSLVTLDEAAKALGLKLRTAQQRASTRGLGRVFGGVRVLTPDDVRELGRVVPAGWPRHPDLVALVTEGAYVRAQRAVDAVRERGEE